MRGSPLWDEFNKFYESDAASRGKRYFDLIKDFFQGYAEFSQVYFFVVRNMLIPEGYHTTSTAFEAVEMFYGRAYEQFASLIEYLAMLNNMLAAGHTMFSKRLRSLTIANNHGRNALNNFSKTKLSWQSALSVTITSAMPRT